MGKSRSVTFTAVYLHCISGLPVDDCLSAIRNARSIAGPNPGFLQQLEEFSQSCDREEIIKPYRGQKEDIESLKKLLAIDSEIAFE